MIATLHVIICIYLKSFPIYQNFKCVYFGNAESFSKTIQQNYEWDYHTQHIYWIWSNLGTVSVTLKNMLKSTRNVYTGFTLQLCMSNPRSSYLNSESIFESVNKRFSYIWRFYNYNKDGLMVLHKLQDFNCR